MNDGSSAETVQSIFEARYLEEYLDFDRLRTAIAHNPRILSSEMLKADFGKTAIGITNFGKLYNTFFRPRFAETGIDVTELAYEIFKEIDSGRLTNVYIDILDKDVDEDIDVGKAAEYLNRKYNSNIDVGLKRVIEGKHNGYNRIIDFSAPRSNSLSIPAVFIKENHFYALFSVATEFNDKLETTIATVDVDLDRGIVIVKARNNPAVNSAINRSEAKTKIPNCPDMAFGPDWLHKFAISVVLGRALALKIRPHNIGAEKMKMYQMHTELVQAVLKRPMEQLENKTHLHQKILSHVQEICGLNRGLYANDEIQQNMVEHIFNIYLSRFITLSFSETKLRNGAKENGAFGFANTIAFSGKNYGSGKMKSGGRAKPLIGNELYFDVKQSLEENKQIAQWNVSWFDCYLYEDDTLTAGHFCNTSIRCEKDLFKVVFLKHKLDSIMIHRVTEKLLNYLVREDEKK